MFSFATFQKIQPIHLTGLLSYGYRWVTSGTQDQVIPNPNFNGDETNKIAIYCIHGTADRNGPFNLLASRLQDKLPPNVSQINVITFENRGRGEGIELIAEQVDKKITKNNDTNVIMIGYSRGGIVAGHYTECLAKAKGVNVLGVIAIAAPFQGSSYALPPISWFSTSVKQMERNSEFLKELSLKVKSSSHNYYYFVGANDSLVDVDSACLAQTTQRSMILDRHGHLSIMSSHRLVNHISHCLFAMSDKNPPRIMPTLNRESLNQSMVEELLTGFVMGEQRSIEEIIQTLSKEIEFEMIKLTTRYHMRTFVEKIMVLDKLKNNLKLLLEPGSQEITTYNTTTIGTYITAFLENTFINNRKCTDILSAPLNSFILFNNAKPETQKFIERLQKEYISTPLPETIINESLNINEPIASPSLRV